MERQASHSKSIHLVELNTTTCGGGDKKKRKVRDSMNRDPSSDANHRKRARQEERYTCKSPANPTKDDAMHQEQHEAPPCKATTSQDKPIVSTPEEECRRIVHAMDVNLSLKEHNVGSAYPRKKHLKF